MPPKIMNAGKYSLKVMYWQKNRSDGKERNSTTALLQYVDDLTGNRLDRYTVVTLEDKIKMRPLSANTFTHSLTLIVQTQALDSSSEGKRTNSYIEL